MSKPPVKILLIEDDEEDYIITREHLLDIPGHKYKLDWAASFDEGLKAIEDKDYDILLIDYRLGRMEGLDLIEQISPEKKGIPFILLTGQGDQELDEKAMAAGAADFITKLNLSGELLDRAIRYSIQQYKALEELVKQKELAQTYLDMAGSIILIVNADETVQEVNHAGIDILGCTEEEILGKNWFDTFIPEKSREAVRNVFDDLIAKQTKLVEHYENEIQSKDGTVRIIKWYNRLLFDQEGKPMATISSGVDVTEQRAAEKSLSNYAIELENKVRARTKKLALSEQNLKEALVKEQELSGLKSRFVAMASHEFRTPLTAILSSVDLIGRYVKEEQQDKREKHIKRVKSSVRNLTGILNDLLSLEKLESNSVNYQPISINLETFMTEFLEEVKLLAKKDQPINLIQKGDPNIQTDEHLLRNILNNLISNAIKYSPEGKEIDLITERENNMLTIKVKDRGIGIPEEDQKHMFSRFFRAGNATAIQGTGLGLTIVKRYLMLMNGEISFTSKSGEGTTFIVSIPQ